MRMSIRGGPPGSRHAVRIQRFTTSPESRSEPSSARSHSRSRTRTSSSSRTDSAVSLSQESLLEHIMLGLRLPLEAADAHGPHEEADEADEADDDAEARRHSTPCRVELEVALLDDVFMQMHRERRRRVVKRECGAFKAGDKVVVTEPNPRYGMGSVVPNRSVGTIRGFDEDDDVVIDFAEMRGWIGQLSEVKIWQSAADSSDSAQPSHCASPLPSTSSAGASGAASSDLPPPLEVIADSEGLPKSFFCPITRQMMTDPVMALDGHTYEREAILQWIG